MDSSFSSIDEHVNEASQIAGSGRAPLWIGVFVALLGALVIGGWMGEVDVLKNLLPHWTTMKANTALGFIISGLALAGAGVKNGSFWARTTAATLATVLILIGGLTLAQYLTGRSFGIDQWIIRDNGVALPATHPGRMSPATAFCFIIVGSMLIAACSSFSARTRIPLVQGLAGALVCLGGIGLLGYFLDFFGSYRSLSYMGMAVHTATGFFLLGIGGCFLAQSGKGAAWWSVDIPTCVVFFCAVVLMLGAIAVAYKFTEKLQQTSEEFASQQETLKSIQDIFTSVADLENSQRGYVITGREDLLEDRQALSDNAHEAIEQLRLRFESNPEQFSRLEALEKIFLKRQEWEARTIATRAQSVESATSLVSSGYGITLSKDLKKLLSELQVSARLQLSEEKRSAREASELAFLLLPLGGFLTITVMVTGMFFLNAGLREKNALATQLQEITNNLPALIGQVDQDEKFLFANESYHRWLGLAPEKIIGRSLGEVVGVETYGRAAPFLRRALAGNRQDYENELVTADGRKIHLQVALIPSPGLKGCLIVAVDITRRRMAEEEVRQINADLEKRVAERTLELEVTNKELEAFSYSVSHDLRAPLRTLDGFSTALMEDYGAVLPAEGQRFIQTIRLGAQQMGQLIDDLLTFSRLSRAAMHVRKVDMADLVGKVLAELPPHAAEISIGALSPAVGDPALLKQVWVNLLSNAVKYSRSRQPAKIEVGAEERAEGTVWFVRDNGTGFDMKYAHKLFGVFQRLHRVEEYEGTGVGLALVQRIVHRHGGAIWCEAAPDLGATFYFTLKQEIAL